MFKFVLSERMCTSHVFCKKIEIPFVAGIDRSTAMRVKEAASAFLTTYDKKLGGMYVLLQPEPQKQREYSLGGRTRALD